MSDRAENLEDIERRLKEDILQEAAKCADGFSSHTFVAEYAFRFGGLILTHNEVASEFNALKYTGPIFRFSCSGDSRTQ